MPDGTGGGYEGATIYRNHVYFGVNLKGEKLDAFRPLGYAGPPLQEGEGLACVELETGKVKGIYTRGPGSDNSAGAGLFIMDGRMVWTCRHLLDAIPDAKGVLAYLGALNPATTRCCRPSGVGGLLYFRMDSGPSLVRCYDLRGGKP